jgi:hypothetical protein
LRRLAKVILTTVAAISLVASIATVVLWRRSDRCWDRITVHQTSEFADQSSSIESVGGCIVLSRYSTQHLRQNPSSDSATIQHQVQRLPPGEAARIVASNEMLLAQQGWCWWGFGSMKTSFAQNARMPWIRLPSNDVVQETYRVVAIPDWAIVLLTLGIPIKFAIGPVRRRYRQAHSGYCANCGYDLRASPERCPECGAVSQR